MTADEALKNKAFNVQPVDILIKGELQTGSSISEKTLTYLSSKGIYYPLGRGSTGRTVPNSLAEKLAMEQAMSYPNGGRQLPIPMTDSRWPKTDGWVKMTQNINGIEIHYVRNTKTGQIDDFKFK